MTLAQYAVHIDHGPPQPFSTRRCSGAAALVDVIEWMLASVGDEAERQRARALLRRRLAHPERVGLGEGPPTLETDQTIHPRSTGRNYANTVASSPLCAGCGWPRNHHNIDGERLDCDGYVEAR